GSGGLVLAGHTDTVPFDARRWQHDPFRLTEENGRLYGLGTCDMKAFLALAIEAAREVPESALKAPLILLATADEESTMAGAKALVEAGRPRARCALIGEPTGLRPVRRHKGIFMEAIEILGRAGHSSDPRLGRSALEGMHRVIGALLHWRETTQRLYRDEGFDVPVLTLNLGRIEGGDNPNRICARCELHLDCRPLPGMAIERVRAEIHATTRRALEGSGLELRFRPLFEGAPSMDTPAEAELVRTAEALTGHAAESVAYATEAPFLQALGMETVVLGPGDIAQAHQPDEFLRIDRIEPMLDILRALIRKYCIDIE
ncbi:MAG: acetylornithine deacetylase, partial [Gammaproteobacteria bacterium]